MANGIVVFWACSRESIEFCMLLFSALKSPVAFVPGGYSEVGEGKTSVNREGGSFRGSLFHIPLPQGKDVDTGCPRDSPAPDDCGVCEAHAADSADGVFGCEAVGDIELLAKELFRGCATF